MISPSMKVTIYTITDCPFCKAEKDYLKERGIAFDEKNLESNKAYLPEMLEASDKFAGVPFTTVSKDDGTVVKLRGFTKEEFDESLMDKAVAKPTTNPMGMGDMSAKSTPSDLPKTDQFNSSMSSTAPVPAAPTPSNPPSPTPMNNPTQGLTPNFGQSNAQTVASQASSVNDSTTPTTSPTMGNDQNLTANPAIGSSPTTNPSGDTNPAQQLDSLLASLRSQTPPSVSNPPVSPVAGQATSQVDTNTTNPSSGSIN